VKIRNGFVSNSSTSSFIILLASKSFKEVIATMDELPQKIITNLVTDEKVCGVDAKTLAYTSGNYDSIEFYDLDFELQKEIEKELGFPYIDLLDKVMRESMSDYGDLVSKHENGYYSHDYS